MRIVRVEQAGNAHYASVTERDRLELLSAAPWHAGVPTGETLSLRDARLLVPVEPSKIVCVGRNYAAHAKELGNELPKEPLLFLKPPSALLASDGAIVLPSASQRVEYESEIGVVIGKRAKQISVSDVPGVIFGVTCVNDVTARDLQRKEVQFTRAKGFDASRCRVRL
jgi:2-keto-4-pentenoate hydratase/2-oxohepta-3-ene-1,7-dioic acid hydratase in catechol pathway